MPRTVSAFYAKRRNGHHELVTVVGHAATISAGEWITAAGEWVNDRTHGQQFKTRFLRSSAPTTTEGIDKYLGSGMICAHRPGLRQLGAPTKVGFGGTRRWRKSDSNRR